MIRFDPGRHIRNVLAEADTQLRRSDGTVLYGIVGRSGAGELATFGLRIGVDRIVMRSGSAFELHTHPGDHILYVLASRGFVHIDGTDFAVCHGDTIYVPAQYPHGVRTDPQVAEPLQLLAFGVPHKPLDSRSRMTVVASNKGTGSGGTR